MAAIDTAGNTSASSASTTITIDQTAPDVSTAAIDLVDNSDTGIKIDDNLTNDTTPSFTVSNVVATDSVYLYFNGLENKKLKASTTSVSFTGDVSTDGTYAATIKSRDIAGNLSDASSALALDWILHLLRLPQHRIYWQNLIVECPPAMILQTQKFLSLR